MVMIILDIRTCELQQQHYLEDNLYPYFTYNRVNRKSENKQTVFLNKGTNGMVKINPRKNKKELKINRK